ncbi:SH3 domain [Trinorchestia longiramus]|nr:SH3 domain [Trinorchestia longiramus]
MARALYSNTAESPDELEFRKDDLLTVLEQNTAGLEGWWLCSLRGRQGICPGNRLRIIPGCYDTGSGVPTTLARPHNSPGLHGAPTSTTMPRSTGNKVVTPKRVGDTYTYDTPRRHVGASPAPPLTHYPTLDYDVPRGPPIIIQKPRLPPREYATRPQTEGPADKNAVRSEGVYDVPPQVSRDARSSDAVDATQARRASDSERVCDNALTGSGLPLEYDSAIDMLSKLQQDVHVSLEKLANFNVVVSPVKKPISDERFNESKIIIDRLKDALQEFIKFAKGATVNGYKAGYERLATTLQQQVERLVSTYDIIKNTWSCAQHNREEALDVALQLTSITKPLSEDVRHLANVIQINAPQIFKRTPSGEQMKQKTDMKAVGHETPTRDVPTENMYANESAILEDYDYVKLESRETADREHQQIKESLPANLRKSYDNLVKQSHSVVDNDHQKALSTSSTSSTVTSKNLNSGMAASKTCRLDANDRQVLAFYSNQAEQHIQHLNTAIDAFFLTIEENQPPKVFIAHSKFVILSAHKLVFIGDTVHRNVVNSEVRSCVLNCSNALCDAMKNTVASAKTAAIQFPSVTAVQAMVDSFTTISNLACNLRNAICRN